MPSLWLVQFRLVAWEKGQIQHRKSLAGSICTQKLKVLTMDRWCPGKLKVKLKVVLKVVPWQAVKDGCGSNTVWAILQDSSYITVAKGCPLVQE
jgi:hypothetical protein